MEVAYHNQSMKMPYLAKLQYIESTGTQYIDTGICPTQSTVTEIVIQRVQYTAGWSPIFGCYDGSQFYTLREANGDQSEVSFSPTGLALNIANDKFYTYHIESGNSWTDAPGPAYKNPTTWTIASTAASIVLFARKDAIVGQATSFFCGGKLRFRSCKISDESGIRCDLFPVKFLNDNNEVEGGMYDKVSKMIFRNIGKGKFILGPETRS